MRATMTQVLYTQKKFWNEYVACFITFLQDYVISLDLAVARTCEQEIIFEDT